MSIHKKSKIKGELHTLIRFCSDILVQEQRRVLNPLYSEKDSNLIPFLQVKILVKNDIIHVET